jgi:hypothetical protein
MSTIQQKTVFMWSFAPRAGAKTPQAEQTNDYFDSGNLQSELHRIKTSELHQAEV